MMKWVYHIRKIFSLIPVSAIPVLLCVLVGCGGSGRIVVSKDLNIPSQTDTKIPFRVGLKLMPEFTEFVYKPKSNAAPVIIGDVLRTGSETVCRNIFDEVVLIEPPSSRALQIDVVVIPTCQGVEYHVVDRATIRVRSRFLWRIMTPDGKEIYSTTVIGEAVRKVSTTVMASTMEREQGEVYFLSLQDQFRKAQNDLHSGGWWKNTWWKQP